MAENSSRRAIEFLVYGALPPHSTNVLWMDSSDPTLPVLKIWWNGAWVPVHTDKSKEVAELAKAVERLTGTNASQQSTIVALTDVTAKEATLTNGIDTIIAAIRNIDLSGVAKQGGNPNATNTAILADVNSSRTDIMGGQMAFDCGEAIPACDFNDAENIYADDGEYIIAETATPQKPTDFGVGSVVKAGSLDTVAEYRLAKTASSPYVYLNLDDHYAIDGVTEWLEVSADKEYICIGKVEVGYTPEGSSTPTVTGYLYLYDEFKAGKSNREVYDALGNIDIDTSDLAKQGTNAGATLTATQTAATNAYASAEAAKTAIGTPASGQPSTLFAAIAAGGSGTVVQMTGTTAEIEPNKLYIWNEVTDLTLTLATPQDPSVVNEYMFMFYSGSTATTLTLPSSVEVRGFIPAQKTICVSIVNNIAFIA